MIRVIDVLAEMKFQDQNLLEYLVYEGLQSEAVEILEEDYGVTITEWNGEVLLDNKPLTGLNFSELAGLLFDEEIRFLYEPDSFQLRIDDFQLLCDKLVEDAL